MSTKLNIMAAGIALAITFALMSALCALAFWIAPDATLEFFGAFMHGIDLKAVKSAAPIALARGLYGVAGLGIVGFVAGVVFASAYNAISER
jgi:2TM family of unknown function (DUF5676)